MTRATANPVSSDPKSPHARMIEWMYFVRAHEQGYVYHISPNSDAESLRDYQQEEFFSTPASIESHFETSLAGLFRKISSEQCVTDDNFNALAEVIDKLHELSLTPEKLKQYPQLKHSLPRITVFWSKFLRKLWNVKLRYCRAQSNYGKRQKFP